MDTAAPFITVGAAAAADVPWPVLPSATAATLLHPVLQLLSQPVINRLHHSGFKQDTEPKHTAAVLALQER